MPDRDAAVTGGKLVSFDSNDANESLVERYGGEGGRGHPSSSTRRRPVIGATRRHQGRDREIVWDDGPRKYEVDRYRKELEEAARKPGLSFVRRRRGRRLKGADKVDCREYPASPCACDMEHPSDRDVKDGKAEIGTVQSPGGRGRRRKIEIQRRT